MEGKGKVKSEEQKRINRDQLLTVGDLEMFKVSLIQEIKNLLTSATSATTKKWLKSSEVRKLLGISPGTLQNLRVNGSLNFTKLGGIIFYDCDEIQKLLRDNADR